MAAKKKSAKKKSAAPRKARGLAQDARARIAGELAPFVPGSNHPRGFRKAARRAPAE